MVEVRATREDRARHNEGKWLESSGRNDGNQKCSYSRTGKDKEVVDRRSVPAGKLEGLYSGK